MEAEKEIKEKFEERVVESVDTDSMNLWGSHKKGVLQACDNLCGKTKERGDRGNTWWWNKHVRDAIDRKKRLNWGAQINRWKVIAKAMKQEAEEKMSVLHTKPNDVFKFVKFMRREGT